MADIFDWDTPVSASGGSDSSPVLPEGTYKFKVTDFQKQQYNGAGKIPACPLAHITLAVEANNGSTVKMYYDLKLCNSLMFLVTNFFICIGEMKPGETKMLPWDRLIGSRGRAYITQRSYQGKDRNGGLLWLDNDGEKTTTNTGTPFMRTVNDIKKCLPYDPKYFGGIPASLKEDTDPGDDEDEPF